jgi:hypothetical protein
MGDDYSDTVLRQEGGVELLESILYNCSVYGSPLSSYANKPKRTSIAKMAYYFEKEICDSHSTHFQGEKERSHSILVVTSTHDKVCELLNEGDFQSLIRSNKDAFIMPLMVAKDAQKSRKKDLKSRKNDLIRQTGLDNTKTHYYDLDYRGGWSDLNKREKGNLSVGQIVEHNGAFYALLLEKNGRSDPSDESSGVWEKIEGDDNQLEITSIDLYYGKSILSELDNQATSGGLAKWRLGKNEMQKTEIGMVFCSLGDALELTSNEHKFDAILIDEHAILLKQLHCSPTKKRKNENDIGYFQKLQKLLLALSKFKLCVRIVSGIASAKTLELPHKRSSARRDKDFNQLILKTKISKFLTLFRKEANRIIDSQKTCKNEKNEKKEIRINAIEILKQNDYGRTEEGTAPEIWKHILELRTLNKDQEKIEKDCGKGWWEKFYRDLNRATYFLCFD